MLGALIRLVVPLLAASCALPVSGTGAVRVGPEPLRLELVRYAGRMTLRAWIDSEEHLVWQLRLDRETFALPVRYTKAQDYHEELRRSTGSPEAADRLLLENLEQVDRLYEADVTSAFEAFWKTGPFTTPEGADRAVVLNDRLRTPGRHELGVTVEPGTVSWSVTLRLVRGEEVVQVLDLESAMDVPPAGRVEHLPIALEVR